MTDLSPAAQAVANAIEPLDWESGHYTYEDIRFISRKVTAAALRAAADQMTAWADEDGRIELDDILAIAAELEGAGA